MSIFRLASDRRPRLLRRWRCLAAAGICAAVLLSPTPQRAEGVAVVLHRDNPAEDLTIRSLRLLYSGFQQRWSHGESVRLVLPATGSESMELLAERIFRLKGESDIDRYYLQAIFRERIPQRPQQLEDREAIAVVERTPGAVALIDPASIPPGAQVRTIVIQGGLEP